MPSHFFHTFTLFTSRASRRGNTPRWQIRARQRRPGWQASPISARFCANRADGQGDVVSCGLNPFGPVPHRVAVPKNGSRRVDLPYFVFYGSKLWRFNPKVTLAPRAATNRMSQAGSTPLPAPRSRRGKPSRNRLWPALTNTCGSLSCASNLGFRLPRALVRATQDGCAAGSDRVSFSPYRYISCDLAYRPPLLLHRAHGAGNVAVAR